jgi:hypothetical protein
MLEAQLKVAPLRTSRKGDQMRNRSKLLKVAIESLLVLGFVMSGSIPGFSRDKDETIDATAFGTGTQLGQNIGVTLNILSVLDSCGQAGFGPGV